MTDTDMGRETLGMKNQPTRIADTCLSVAAAAFRIGHQGSRPSGRACHLPIVIVPSMSWSRPRHAWTPISRGFRILSRVPTKQSASHASWSRAARAACQATMASSFDIVLHSDWLSGPVLPRVPPHLCASYLELGLALRFDCGRRISEIAMPIGEFTVGRLGARADVHASAKQCQECKSARKH